MSELLPNTRALIEKIELFAKEWDCLDESQALIEALELAEIELSHFTTPDAWVITSIEADLKRVLNRLEGYKETGPLVKGEAQEGGNDGKKV